MVSTIQRERERVPPYTYFHNYPQLFYSIVLFLQIYAIAVNYILVQRILLKYVQLGFDIFFFIHYGIHNLYSSYLATLPVSTFEHHSIISLSQCIYTLYHSVVVLTYLFNQFPDTIRTWKVLNKEKTILIIHFNRAGHVQPPPKAALGWGSLPDHRPLQALGGVPVCDNHGGTPQRDTKETEHTGKKTKEREKSTERIRKGQQQYIINLPYYSHTIESRCWYIARLHYIIYGQLSKSTLYNS